MLRLECIRHVVSFRRTLEVVENCADIRSALQIRNAQGRSALEHMGPCSASVNDFLPKNGSFVHVNLSSTIFGSLLVGEGSRGRGTGANVHARAPQVTRNRNLRSFVAA